MRVTILPDRKTEEMEPATVAELLKRLGLHSDAYLVVRDEEILTRDVRLKAEDSVDVIPVISGGSNLPARRGGYSGEAGGGGDMVGWSRSNAPVQLPRQAGERS
jgi:sulfur carrier protein ThiS